MTRQAQHLPHHAAAGPQAERFQQAEQKLWDHYGLEPAELHVDLDHPTVRLRVQQVGAGPPVLLIGGSGGTGAYWAPLVSHLQGLRCVIVDRPGFGLSAPIDYHQHAYRTVAADILRGVLDQLGIDRAHSIGASIGDTWALALAAHHPDRTKHVVLMGGGPLTDEIAPPPFIRLLASPAGAVLVRIPATPRMLRAQLRGPVGQKRAVAAGQMDAFIDWYLALSRHTGTLRHERDMVRAIVHRKGWRDGLTFTHAELAAIAHPTLMVYGTSDPVGSTHTWRRFTNDLPHGELHLVEGAGHLAWYDDPTGIADRVRAFLDI